jgi:hypothetical protein
MMRDIFPVSRYNRFKLGGEALFSPGRLLSWLFI